jgi:hypothetical protein
MLETDTPSGAGIDCAALSALLSRNAATVVDLSLSRNYLAGHISGAWFAIRGRLAGAFKKIPPPGILVLTSEDGVLARLAVAEAASMLDCPVRFLDGSNAAWQSLDRGPDGRRNRRSVAQTLRARRRRQGGDG